VVIQLGQLRLHFLVTGDNLSGSIALFELIVAIGEARLMAPAHSHNHYQETICGVDEIRASDVAAKLLGGDREIYPKSQEALTDELIAAQAALRKELGIEVVEVEVVGPIESKKVFAPPTVVHPVVATALRGGVKITACRHQAA